MKKLNKKNAQHILVGFFTAFSLLESIIGFLPFNEDLKTQSRIFFMGLTLIGAFFEINSYLLEKNDLNKMVENGLILSKESRIESNVLLNYESDLDMLFKRKNGKYFIIILTVCLDMNEEKFIKTIWENIKNNKCKYLYITPDNDQEFINSLTDTIKRICTKEKLTDIYKMVVNNIFHVQDKKMFEFVPKYYDMCVYYNNINGRISLDGALGYACFQNKPIILKNEKYYFYYEMSYETITDICKKHSDIFFTEKILNSYKSGKIEIKNSSIDGLGLFCKKEESIKKGEICFIKGGYELHKSELFSSKVINSYLQIADDLFLAAKEQSQEEFVKLYINHSCKPNLHMLNDRTFVASRDINGGEELTIDYAFVDNEKYEFLCACGEKNCRKKITGMDWDNPEVKKQYNKSYFAPYIRKKL